jgi:hypothetical protein
MNLDLSFKTASTTSSKEIRSFNSVSRTKTYIWLVSHLMLIRLSPLWFMNVRTKGINSSGHQAGFRKLSCDFAIASSLSLCCALVPGRVLNRPNQVRNSHTAEHILSPVMRHRYIHVKVSGCQRCSHSLLVESNTAPRRYNLTDHPTQGD